MPIYNYTFCDGTSSQVEVSEEEYALLIEMDSREHKNNRKHKRRNVPMQALLKQENAGGKPCARDCFGCVYEGCIHDER